MAPDVGGDGTSVREPQSSPSQSRGGLMLDARRELPLMREVTALQKNLRTLQDPGTSSGSVTTTSCSSGGHQQKNRKKKRKGKTQTFIGDPHQDAQALARELSGKLAKSVDHGASSRREPTTKHNIRIEKLQTKRRTASASPEMELGVRARIQRIETALRPATRELRKEGLLRELRASADPQKEPRSSLAELLQGKRHEERSNSAPNLLRMVQDEEQRNGESLFESTDDAELRVSAPKPTASTLRGEDEVKKPRSNLKQKPVAAQIILDGDDDDDPELSASELRWQWDSRIHKYGGRAFLDLTGLTSSAIPESGMPPELHPPVQSISSLDSDANALPLVIGDDSDLAGFFSSGAARKRKASLQNAVKDVPETSRTKSAARTLTQKYRPKNFKEIAGQSVVVKSLSTAILKSKVAPVYLFMGPRGTGKTSAARVFAAGLNCLSLDVATRPCGICRECGLLALNRSADVRQIDAAANADLASMRAMMGSFTPRARFKVFIVESSDLLTTEIWNSFLKLLEEPPVNVVFILITTEVDRIPATATSRCQKFQFSKLKEADIVSRLEYIAGREGLVVEPKALSLIATKADGSLRDAEIVLDQLCLLHQNVSVAAVQELVGVLPDHKLLDLLDQALSANTVNIVRTTREVLAAGVEPLALVSQLGAMITDILVGSLVVDRDSSSGFFSHRMPEKEEVNRLRQALKVLSEAEKQLRVAADGGTWLTAALLQFAPDRAFLPNSSSSPSPSPARDPADEIHPPLATVEEDAVLDHVADQTLSEQKLEEAWAGEPQAKDSPPEGDDAGPVVELQVFGDEALAELWKRVIWEVQPRNLKNMLQTQGRLVAAGVAVDGSCAVVELEFDHARDKHKAERSWRSICIAFQAVLSTAVELRIALSDAVPEESEVVRVDDPATTDGGEGEPASKQPEEESEQVAAARRHRKRASKARRHRHATELQQRELGAQQFSSDVSGVTPRRPPPPSRRRRAKKLKRGAGGGAAAAAKPEVGAGGAAPDHNTLTREIWDALSVDMISEEKKLLRSMMQEPQSEIDDLQAAQTKILKQRSLKFRGDASGLTAIIVRRNSLIADLQRGLPPQSSMGCWSRGTPQSEFLMRKSNTLKSRSIRRTQPKTLFLKMVPCAATHTIPALSAPPAA